MRCVGGLKRTLTKDVFKKASSLFQESWSGSMDHAMGMTGPEFQIAKLI